MDVYKIYAVIAMCLELKEDTLSDAEIIVIINAAFKRIRRLFAVLEKVINIFPYRISKCMYIEMFDYYGIRGLCKIFCLTDEFAYANLPKHVKFIRYSDLSDGECCHDEVVDRKYLE